MRKLHTYCLILAISLLATACKKKNVVADDAAPKIAYTGISQTSFEQFSDSIYLTLSYEDADGDLGHEDADIASLEILDTRLSKPDMYYVQPLAPLKSKIRIKGQLQVSLRNLFLLGTGAAETTFLEIRIKDRAGNWSNLVRTPELTITK